MTWVDIGLFFAVLVVGSFIAGFVDTWLEQRKWDKNKRQGGSDGSKTGIWQANLPMRQVWTYLVGQV